MLDLLDIGGGACGFCTPAAGTLVSRFARDSSACEQCDTRLQMINTWRLDGEAVMTDPGARDSATFMRCAQTPSRPEIATRDTG